MSRTLLTLPVLLLAASLQPAPNRTPPPPPAPLRHATAERLVGLPPVTPPFRTAAVAVRHRDFLGALRALEPVSQRDDALGRHGRVVAGLYAHSLERPADAARLLGEEPEAPGPLEDWRLWVLADTRAATGDAALGLAALDRLLGDFPDSPLWPRAVVRAVELARDAGKPQRAAELVALARRRPLAADDGERLERLAFQIGTQSGDRELAASAATALLTHYPLAANELGVGDRFPVYLLPAADVRLRAQTLLDAGMAGDALRTLDVTPRDQRDLEWSLLEARALTLTGKAPQAVALLAALEPDRATDVARLAYTRAQAELAQAPSLADAGHASAPRGSTRSSGRASGGHASSAHGKKAAKPAKGKKATSHGKSSRHAAASKPKPSPVADEHRQRAWEDLQQAARLGDADVAARALRRLFREQVAAEWWASAKATLARLEKVDPEDDSGTPFLWQRGWSDYRDHDYRGAMEWWKELVAQAPRERYPRAARYWTARALDATGEHEQARALYHELAAADTTDFYRRHALLRLHEPATTPATTPPTAPEPWPTDKLLARARYLTDVGLDDLAATELALVGDRAEPRARAALAAVVLARQGRPRPSMDQLRRAFPALGTPLQASVPPEALELYYPLHFREPIEHWASARELPVPLVLGVIRQESAFDLKATSTSGARGLMQLMPGTARDLAVKLGMPFATDRLYEPDYSVQLGTSYLAHVVGLFDGNVELALAGYNAGPYRLKRQWNEAHHPDVDSFIENLQLEEPKTYVKRILVLSDSYSRLYPELAQPG